MILLEACCGSVEEALAAQSAGADRLELCAGLPTGGVTPSPGMIEETRTGVSVPIIAMVRPREGGPDLPAADFRAAVRDMRHCIQAGADEVICGVLDADNRIDMDRNRELIAAAEGRPVAFHRVFDMTPDLDAALESVIELGFCRILTSGGQDNVDLGMAGLARLVSRSNGRIAILAGGGVRLHNAKRLVEEAGCTELHFSFRAATEKGGYGGMADFVPVPDRIKEIRAAIG